MNTIVLDLKINGIDVSMHDVVVTINGHALNSKGNGKIMPTQDPSVGFGAFINQEVELLAKNHRIRSSEIRKYVLKQFMQWRDGQDIAIDNVTAEVMDTRLTCARVTCR